MAAVAKPSEAAYTAAPSPAGPAPTTTNVGFVGHRVGVPAVPPGGPARLLVGFAQHLTAPDHHRGVLGRYSEPLQQPFGVLVTFQVKPAVRQSVSRGELAQPGRCPANSRSR